MAIGDFDNDGAVDVLVSVNDGAPLLLRNNAGKAQSLAGRAVWLGTKSNRDAVGARVTYQAGDLKRQPDEGRRRELSCRRTTRDMVLGLGAANEVDWLEVKWPRPSDATERFTDLPIDRYITIVEGHAKWK